MPDALHQRTIAAPIGVLGYAVLSSARINSHGMNDACLASAIYLSIRQAFSNRVAVMGTTALAFGAEAGQALGIVPGTATLEDVVGYTIGIGGAYLIDRFLLKEHQ
jgi:hypothetical protein